MTSNFARWPSFTSWVRRTERRDYTGSERDHSSLFEPHIGEILADVVAWRHVPALEFHRVDDRAVPPQERYRVGVGEGVPLEFAHDLGALPHIGGDRLTDIERIEKAVGRTRVIAWRQVTRNIAGQLYRRIIE